MVIKMSEIRDNVGAECTEENKKTKLSGCDFCINYIENKCLINGNTNCSKTDFSACTEFMIQDKYIMF